MSKSNSVSPPWLCTWPTNELQNIKICPVCGSSKRNVLYNNLIDITFLTAPGLWTLKSCGVCHSAYLDPRPNQESIGKAYNTYYTHKCGADQTKLADLGLFRRLRRMLANGYLNNRYGAKREPSLNLGVWLVKLLPRQSSILDMQYRYLPKPIQGQALLDIGCGNGDFLLNAREAGWVVSGVEPDMMAVEIAQKRGLNVVLGTIDYLALQSNCFDAITLSHVIEHVHDPMKLLQAMNRLLKPDGIVYIDTPNIQSVGAQLFRNSWRGIEAPRHLVIFSTEGLVKLLSLTGFCNVDIKRRTDVQKGMCASSERIDGVSSSYGFKSNKLGWLSNLKMRFFFPKTKNLEYITLTAKKREI